MISLFDALCLRKHNSPRILIRKKKTIAVLVKMRGYLCERIYLSSFLRFGSYC